jgi:dimethylargininase
LRGKERSKSVSGLAFTRDVSPKLADCALTHLARAPISASAAAVQHERYERALRDSGLDVIRLASLPNRPDAVFVEDTAVLLDEHAIITRPGASSRADEVRSTAKGLSAYFEVLELAGGTLDGGDVLRIGKTLYVGSSTRTNAGGLAALRDVASRLGFDVVQTEVRHCLHLKTAATFAGPDAAGDEIVVYDPRCIDPAQFAGVKALPVHPDERGAANVLRVNDRLIIPARYAHTADALRDRGYVLVEVDVSELEKAEAGVTCMSLVYER